MSIAVHPFVEHGLGNSSYLLDAGGGLAAIIDPRRDVEVYLEAAAEAGLRVAAIFETHLHADFVSGARELAERTQAVAYLPAEAGATWGAIGLSDGDHIPVGDVVIAAVATPGHTPEHLSFVVERNGLAEAAFTGGALMVGGVARTDLVADEMTDGLTRAARRSALRLLEELPSEARVLPTHGPGSFCSVGPGGDRQTTVGAERTNPLWSLMEEPFVERIRAGLGAYPAYFRHLRTVNIAPLPRPPMPPRLDAAALRDEIARGTVVVDARSVDRWAEGHVRGAVADALRPQFATWLGWVVEWGSRIAIIVEAEAEAREAVRQATGIGFDDIAGIAFADLDAWRGAGIPVATAGQIAPAEVVADPSVQIVDVREPVEVATGMVPGAMPIPLGAVGAAAGSLDASRPVIAYCGHGERAATALSLLEARGFERLVNLRGGMGAWSRARLPLS